MEGVLMVRAASVQQHFKYVYQTEIPLLNKATTIIKKLALINTHDKF